MYNPNAMKNNFISEQTRLTNDRVMINQCITEYKINIDSLDRDIEKYPNPFDFVVSFNAQGSRCVTQEFKKGKNVEFKKTLFKGASGPIINRSFKNVKYIKLESIVLPQYAKYNVGDDVIVPSKKHCLLNDRFVQLVINELIDDTKYVYSTSDDGDRYIDTEFGIDKFTPPDPFGIIFPDDVLGKVYYNGLTCNAKRIYKDSNLKNLTKMSIKFYDSYGLPLIYDHMEKDVCACSIDNIKNPLHKDLQVYLSFVVGVVEPNVNTVPNYL